jgi:hypothetical protein
VDGRKGRQQIQRDGGGGPSSPRGGEVRVRGEEVNEAAVLYKYRVQMGRRPVAGPTKPGNRPLWAPRGMCVWSAQGGQEEGGATR